MQEITQVLSLIFTKLGADASLGGVTISNRPDLCDFQCNGSFAAAKVLKQSPQSIAQKVIETLPLEVKESYIFDSVNGFINITLKDATLLQAIPNSLEIKQEAKSVVIDYGSPNVAKGMHVGHLRSTLIGNALVKIHKAKGHLVTGDNHLGDFGTPLGIVITKILSQTNFEWNLANIESLYVQGSVEYKTNEEFKIQVQKNTYLLQTNNPEIKTIWQKIVDTTIADLKSDYQTMGVEFDQWNGESVFESMIPAMIEDLSSKGLISKSNGATVMPLAGSEQPLILEKASGGYLYHTTDLACVKARQKYDLMLYVVDKRQSLHFNQVFEAAKMAGYLKPGQAEHISFGTINGSDGKPFKTRSGEVLKLKDLITQFFSATEAKLNPNLTTEEQSQITPVLAMGSLKFAELKNSRNSDYVFNLDSFTALEGYTGPYVMYAAVRSKSILKKVNQEKQFSDKIYSLSERNLLFALSQFQAAFDLALNNNEPHHLCSYLYDLSTKFNSFYSENHIANELDEKKQKHLLAVTEHFFQTMEQGLSLLGISLPVKM